MEDNATNVGDLKAKRQAGVVRNHRARDSHCPLRSLHCRPGWGRCCTSCFFSSPFQTPVLGRHVGRLGRRRYYTSLLLKSYYLGFGRGRKILSILLAPRSNSGITPVGLLERYKDTASPPFIAPSVAAKPIEHPRTAGHLGSHRMAEVKITPPLVSRNNTPRAFFS